MKTAIVISLLSGALLASATLNVLALRQVDSSSPPCKTGNTTCAAVGSQPTCRMVEQLGLTPTQCQQLFGCCGGACGQRRSESDQRLQVLLKELNQELNATQFDRQHINKLTDEIARLRTAEWQDTIQCILRVRETLTPDQLERLVSSVEGP
ncbi:MAG: periplasmic heavy metal sensor [Planctomycetota bacterium]